MLLVTFFPYNNRDPSKLKNYQTEKVSVIAPTFMSFCSRFKIQDFKIVIFIKAFLSLGFMIFL